MHALSVKKKSAKKLVNWTKLSHLIRFLDILITKKMFAFTGNFVCILTQKAPDKNWQTEKKDKIFIKIWSIKKVGKSFSRQKILVTFCELFFYQYIQYITN